MRQFAVGVVRKWSVEQFNRTFQWRLKCRQCSQKRRFAGSVATQKTGQLATRDRGREPFGYDVFFVPHAIAYPQVVEPYGFLPFHSLRSFLRLRSSTHITTGAPISAVTELMGNTPSNPGMRAITLQNSASAAPISSDAGINIRWSEVPKIPRQRCGTASPKNMIGPQ